jgi:hypothetical protein
VLADSQRPVGGLSEVRRLAGAARGDARTCARRVVVALMVTDASLGRQRATADKRGRHAATARSRLPVSVVAVSAATGVLVVAAAYTSGRFGYASSSWADRTYWLGQALIWVPTAARLLSQRFLTASETVSLITILTVAEFLVTICYSPAAFTYIDELEHWRSTSDVLQTGKLFTVNYLLPISPHYPGLEEVTSALASITGLSVFTSGLIIAGIAHLLFVYVLYVLFREVSGSYRLAGVALLCYASNSHFASFDSMFIYQTLALPFLALTLLAAWRLASNRTSGQRAGWLTLAMLAIVATVVTHHVTSYVLAAMLVVITLAALITRGWWTAAWAAGLATLTAVAVVGWLLFAAPETPAYLQPFADATLQSFRSFLAGHGGAPPTSVVPLGNRVLGTAAVLIMSALLPVGWWQVWRRYRDQPWIVAMAIASVSWYLIVAVRFTVTDGSQLAGRAATFVFVPAAYIAALALGHIARTAVRWQARIAGAAVLAVVISLIFDGLANGWPPYWERLPGPHQVAGFERSVGPEEIAAARWALAALGPGNRFATDLGSYAVLGSYGDQNPLRDVAYLYTSSAFTPLDVVQAQIQELRYVWVDRRLSQSLPAFGQYFPIDPNAGKYTHPLPWADLDKFNYVPGVARIYDSGNIVIYQLAGP